MSLASSSSRAARHTIARRILVSFAIALTAFAVTLGFGVRALRQSQRDSERLSEMLVPVALKLGQLRASQATLATLVDGVSDERDPVSTRHLLGTLTSERSVRVAELETALAALQQQPGELGNVGLRLGARLGAVSTLLGQDSAHFESLFAALGSKDEANTARELVDLGAIEHDASHALRGMSATVNDAIAAVSSEGRDREAQSLFALFMLAAGTLGLGLFLAVRTQRLLRPLEKLLSRVRAVAAGDRTPHPITPTDTEIGELEVGFEQMVVALEGEQTRRLSNERFAAIGKMAAHVTHEIRNPLSSIALNVELLEDDLASASEESRELLRAIRREVERLTELSGQYLSFARRGPQRLEVEDLREVVGEAAEFMRRELAQQGVSLELHNAPVPVPATVDEAQIKQALYNLMRNAREAMPSGGRVKVSVNAGAGGGSDVIVEDEGVGLDEATRARLFEPFFTTKSNGTGLGLAITRQIIEAHGGTIACEPNQPRGTRIWIHLGDRAAAA